jgi:type IV pilus assembly protein PilA
MKKILQNKKGFTLMEIIVVLVILAIVAAALLPSFLNFVSRARNDSLMAQARVGMVAVQLLITERGVADAASISSLVADNVLHASPTSASQPFQYLVFGDVDSPNGFTWTPATQLQGNRVTGITYTSGGRTVTIAPPASPTS